MGKQALSHTVDRKVRVCACSAAKSCPTVCDPTDCSPLGSLSMGLPRQEHWTGWPFPTPGDLNDPGIESPPPALAGSFFTTSHLESPDTKEKGVKLIYW